MPNMLNLTSDDVQFMADLYAQGHSIPQIARAYSVSNYTVHERLRALPDWSPRNPGRQPLPVDLSRLADLCQQRLPVTQIADQLGVRRWSVSYWINAAAVPYHRPIYTGRPRQRSVNR